MYYPNFIVGTVLGAVFGTISGLCFLISACSLIFCCLRLRKNLVSHAWKYGPNNYHVYNLIQCKLSGISSI